MVIFHSYVNVYQGVSIEHPLNVALSQHFPSGMDLPASGIDGDPGIRSSVRRCPWKLKKTEEKW